MKVDSGVTKLLHCCSQIVSSVEFEEPEVVQVNPAVGRNLDLLALSNEFRIHEGREQW